MILTVSALFVVVPAYGLVGAAWVVTLSILLIRGAYLAALICYVNGFSLTAYVGAIYGRPLLVGIPVTLTAVWLKGVLPGGTWFELMAAGTMLALVAYGLSLFFVLDPVHRARLLARVGLASRVKHANV